MKKPHAEDLVGPWAEQKLDALENYLAAYHKVMKYQKFKLIYIDAFAGAGWSKIRTSEQQEAELGFPLDSDQETAQEKFIAGSPVRALTTGNGFDQYYFFDADKRRTARLRQLKQEHLDKEVYVKDEDANLGVQKLARRFHESPLARGVAFLDPYGPHLHWATVEALAKTRKVDVIINFPLAMAINRLITRNIDIPRNWVNLLDKCFGTRQWYDLAYEIHRDLFGNEQSWKRDDTESRLLQLYHRRLENCFGNTVNPSLVRNTKGAPLYYLMWASSNSRGKAIASHIMKAGHRIERLKPK
ncbi:MAG: three-Cys-motif partner protein TcmP [Rhodobacteraceae bacterium]|nr:three-Cys-motif partner protein TcmP [Paracoccaceae bacterium]